MLLHFAETMLHLVNKGHQNASRLVWTAGGYSFDVAPLPLHESAGFQLQGGVSKLEEHHDTTT